MKWRPELRSGTVRNWHFVLLGGIVVVLGIAILSRREPTHQGKTATFWLDYWATYKTDAMDKSVTAFEAMGTNGTWFLVKTLEHSPSKLERQISAWSGRFGPPDWIAKRLPDVFIIEQRRSASIDILAELGPKARPARSALVQLVENQHEDAMDRESAKRALRYLDEQER